MSSDVQCIFASRCFSELGKSKALVKQELAARQQKPNSHHRPCYIVRLSHLREYDVVLQLGDSGNIFGLESCKLRALGIET